MAKIRSLGRKVGERAELELHREAGSTEASVTNAAFGKNILYYLGGE